MLLENGYIHYPNDTPIMLAIDKTYFKRVNRKDVVCDHNGDKLSFKINEYAAYHHSPTQYQISLMFEKNGQWWDFTACSISEKELTEEKLKEIENKLIALYLAI